MNNDELLKMLVQAIVLIGNLTKATELMLGRLKAVEEHVAREQAQRAVAKAQGR